jgi:hypothetical protein
MASTASIDTPQGFDYSYMLTPEFRAADSENSALFELFQFQVEKMYGPLTEAAMKLHDVVEREKDYWPDAGVAYNRYPLESEARHA